MRPDGTQVAYIRSVNTIISPGFVYPYYAPRPTAWSPSCSCGRLTGDKGQTVARVDHQHRLAARPGPVPAPVAGDGVRPDGICIAAPPGASGGVRADGGELTRSQRTLSNPAASPDGRYLAAVAEAFSAAPGFTETFRGAIALFDPATGAFLRDLTTAHADGAPAFSPDGRQVAFTRGEDLYVVAIVGRPRPKLLRHGVRDPTWGAR